MAIIDILLEIELRDNPIERCIAYAEVIVYLKHIKETYRFMESHVEWKNDINDQLVKLNHDFIDKQVSDIKKLMENSLKQ